MWTAESLAVGAWEDEGSRWYFDVRGGDHGIWFGNAPGTDQRTLSVAAVDQPALPAAAEQYVQGDRWIVNYPQQSGGFALRLSLEPIETTANRLVIEMTVAVQTDLLDSHPKVDIDVDCHDIDSFVPTNPLGDEEVTAAGSAPISLAKGSEVSAAVLLGPHDSPFTTNHSTDCLLRLRLFGDFLEKGVIRKARPWIVIDRSGSVPSEKDLERWWQRLCDSPLPLTP